MQSDSASQKRPFSTGLFFVGILLVLSFFFFFSLTLLLSSFWTSRGHRCRSFSPPVLAFDFYRAWGSAIPLLVDFSSRVANSRSRAFRKSICAQEKVPSATILHEYAIGGARTHETDLDTGLEDNLIRFPQVNLCTKKSPIGNDFIRVCNRRGSNSRN